MFYFFPTHACSSDFECAIVQIDELTNDLALILTWTDRPLEKVPHPKTAGPMAENQKSTLKHLLFTLAIFTGGEKEGEKEDSQRRHTGEDHNLAYSLNGPFYRRSRDLDFS